MFFIGDGFYGIMGELGTIVASFMNFMVHANLMFEESGQWSPISYFKANYFAKQFDMTTTIQTASNSAQ